VTAGLEALSEDELKKLEEDLRAAAVKAGRDSRAGAEIRHLLSCAAANSTDFENLSQQLKAIEVLATTLGLRSAQAVPKLQHGRVWLSFAEAASLLGLNRSQIPRNVENGKLIQRGRDKCVHLVSIIDLLLSRAMSKIKKLRGTFRNAVDADAFDHFLENLGRAHSEAARLAQKIRESMGHGSRRAP
jgi:hypothetical protein